MNTDSIFRVEISDPEAPDLVLDELETLGDREFDLDALLKRDRPISLDFRVSAPSAISIVDAAGGERQVPS